LDDIGAILIGLMATKTLLKRVIKGTLRSP